MLPRGIRNNNPFNIKEHSGDRTQWVGERATDDDKIFEEFTTMEDGIRAGLIILRNYNRKHGIKNIREIITRFAPSNENNTRVYIRVVADYVGLSPDAVIDFNDEPTMTLLARAIAKHENGGEYITNEQIHRAWLRI